MILIKGLHKNNIINTVQDKINEMLYSNKYTISYMSN